MKNVKFNRGNLGKGKWNKMKAGRDYSGAKLG